MIVIIKCNLNSLIVSLCSGQVSLNRKVLINSQQLLKIQLVKQSCFTSSFSYNAFYEHMYGLELKTVMFRPCGGMVAARVKALSARNALEISVTTMRTGIRSRGGIESRCADLKNVNPYQLPT